MSKEFTFTFDSNKSAEENQKDIQSAVNGFVKENFIDKENYENLQKEFSGLKLEQSNAKAKTIFGKNLDVVKDYLDLEKINDQEYVNKIKADFKLEERQEPNPSPTPAPFQNREPITPKADSKPAKDYKFSRYIQK